MKKDQTSPIKRLHHLLTYGNLWLYILSLIEKNKMIYAYALDSEIEKTFDFKPSKIMVYVVLYRLESEGLISSEKKERRKYYTMKDKGKTALVSARDYFKTLSKRL